MHRVVVVGSGLAGLSAARAIQAQTEGHGIEVVILESGDCAGGRARTRQLPSGTLVELGATWLHGVAENPLYDLIVYQGLGKDIRGDPSIQKHDIDWQLHFARPYAPNGTAPPEMLTGRLREVALDAVYRFTEAAEECHELTQENANVQSVGAVLRRRFDEAVAELKLQGPELAVFAESWWCREKLQRTFDGFFCTDDVSLAFPRELEVMEGPNLPMPGGWEALTTYLSSGLDIRFNHRVASVEYGEGGVQVTCSNGAVFDCDTVIITVSIGVLQANHTRMFQPPLPEWKQAAMTAVRIGVADKIFAEFEIDEEAAARELAEAAASSATASVVAGAGAEGSSKWNDVPAVDVFAPPIESKSSFPTSQDSFSSAGIEGTASPYAVGQPPLGATEAGASRLVSRDVMGMSPWDVNASYRLGPGGQHSQHANAAAAAVVEPRRQDGATDGSTLHQANEPTTRSWNGPSSGEVEEFSDVSSLPTSFIFGDHPGDQSADSSESALRKRHSDFHLEPSSLDELGGGATPSKVPIRVPAGRATAPLLDTHVSSALAIQASMGGNGNNLQDCVGAPGLSKSTAGLPQIMEENNARGGETGVARGASAGPVSAPSTAKRARRRKKIRKVVDSYGFMWPISQASQIGSSGAAQLPATLPGGVEYAELPEFAQKAGVPSWCLGLHSVRFNPGPCWVTPAKEADEDSGETAATTTPGTSAVFWITGNAALEMEKKSDEEVQQGLASLLTVFPQIPRPAGAKFPPRIVRTKWGTDPNFLGSYSYSRCGVMDGTAVDLLAEPIFDTTGIPIVMFAGEATHRAHMGTAHGAFMSGLREANRLMDALEELDPADTWPLGI